MHRSICCRCTRAMPVAVMSQYRIYACCFLVVSGMSKRFFRAVVHLGCTFDIIQLKDIRYSNKHINCVHKIHHRVRFDGRVQQFGSLNVNVGQKY